MVGLDVLEGFHVPGRGELKSTVDLIQTCDQVVVHGAGSTSHQAVRDHAQVVAHVPGALRLAFGSGGVVGTLHLGGVRELGVDGLSSAVHQAVSLAGEGFGSFEARFGTVETAGSSLNLGVAQETTLRISCCNSFGEGGFHESVEGLMTSIPGADQATEAAARSK